MDYKKMAAAFAAGGAVLAAGAAYTMKQGAGLSSTTVTRAEVVCAIRVAAAKPAGPAPTIATSVWLIVRAPRR